MWNLATDAPDNIGNNKTITPMYDLKFPFSVSSDNDMLEENIVSFDTDWYR